MNKETLNKLKELAQKAVPGPWSAGNARMQNVHEKFRPMTEVPIHVGEGTLRGNCHAIVYNGGLGATSSAEDAVTANAAFIAAANPAAVLELIALAERTTSPVSQAPAVRIENDWHSRANVLEARLGEVMEKRDEWRAMAEKAMDDVADHYNRLCKAEARATAAEAKLEAIRQNLENLDRYDADYQRGDGVWLVVKGAYIDRADALALFQPQPQADESGLTG